jgi:predicted TIM-barrel fold metal-dependent hydrolase
MAPGPIFPGWWVRCSRAFGPYEPIRRDYPIREYLDDLAGNGVVKSVYVQTNWAKARFEDETAWVQRTS